MTTRLAALLLTLLPAAVPALAGEDLSSHATHPHKTVVLGKDVTLPSNLQMGKDDVLVFENYSSSAITIRFIEPEEQVDKVRCGLVQPRASKDAPSWAHFAFDARKHLTATLPPGQFASLCTLAPGSYTYETVRAFGTHVGKEPAATKNTITVE